MGKGSRIRLAHFFLQARFNLPTDGGEYFGDLDIPMEAVFGRILQGIGFRSFETRGCWYLTEPEGLKTVFVSEAFDIDRRLLSAYKGKLLWLLPIDHYLATALLIQILLTCN